MPVHEHQRLRYKSYAVFLRTVANLQSYFAMRSNEAENWYSGGLHFAKYVYTAILLYFIKA